VIDVGLVPNQTWCGETLFFEERVGGSISFLVDLEDGRLRQPEVSIQKQGAGEIKEHIIELGGQNFDSKKMDGFIGWRC
jgi:hypothetical protein